MPYPFRSLNTCSQLFLLMFIAKRPYTWGIFFKLNLPISVFQILYIDWFSQNLISLPLFDKLSCKKGGICCLKKNLFLSLFFNKLSCKKGGICYLKKNLFLSLFFDKLSSKKGGICYLKKNWFLYLFLKYYLARRKGYIISINYIDTFLQVKNNSIILYSIPLLKTILNL